MEITHTTNGIEYRLRTKKIWKGKIAPRGCMFVVVDFKRYKSNYYMSQAVHGTMDEAQLKELGDKMVADLKAHYNF